MAYKTFNRFLKSLSIKKKLTYTLIPVILVTYLFSVGSVYMVSFHETKSIVNQQVQTLANQRTQLVDSYLDQLRTETEIFMFDTAFQKRFRTNRSTLSLSQQEELNKEITQYMYSMIISYNVYVESITLINNHLDSYNWHMDGRNSYSAYISRLLPLSDTLTELDGGILYTYDKLDQGVVTIARLIKDPIYNRKIGILMLDFNLGFLNKMTGVRTKDQKLPMPCSPLPTRTATSSITTLRFQRTSCSPFKTAAPVFPPTACSTRSIPPSPMRTTGSYTALLTKRHSTETSTAILSGRSR